MGKPALIQVQEQFDNKWWRLNNLYHIVDEDGHDVPFRCRWVQEKFYDDMHYLNIILKARQLGFTTEICLYILDDCLFIKKLEAAIIAHSLSDAKKIFRRKIKYPYDHLPDALRNKIYLTTDSKEELKLSNESILSVSTSVRSGTVQRLLVSEHGKICRKYPEKAEEIRTGSFNAIHRGQIIWVESTAEGRQGDFYDMCQTARKRQQRGQDLTEMDFKFHFFPWYQNPKYTLDAHVEIPVTLLDYFKSLATNHGIELTDGQKAWYTKKKELMGDKMKQEHPSTPDEPFEVQLEGAYFKSQFERIYKEKRIFPFIPVEDGVPVDTWWDLGISDTTAIWFTQDVGREVRVVDFYERSGEGLGHYASMLRSKGYEYGTHTAPHDIEVRELGTGVSRKETALSKYQIDFEVAPKLPKVDQIEAARQLLQYCSFSERTCSEGIKALENYRKEWDEKWSCYRNRPLHNWASNPADAFEVLAVAHSFNHDSANADEVLAAIMRRGVLKW